MSIHHLKTWPEPFSAVWDGEKNFEVRRNDRQFQPLDKLVLQEWYPGSERWGERIITATVPYILEGGQFGIEPGYVVMQLTDIQRSHADVR